MGEQIFAAVFGCNKAKTFGLVKPFHCTCCHVLHFLKKREAPLGVEGQNRRRDEGRITYEGRTKNELQRHNLISKPYYALFPAIKQSLFTQSANIHQMSDIRILKQVLKQHRTIAVVGLSADWFRPSYFAAKYMQAHGYKIVPVNPKYPNILDEHCYASLAEIPFPVDIVDVFRKPADTPAIAQQAADIGAKVLWLQLGVVNVDAERIAQQAGLTVIMDRCVKIEHARLFGGLGWFGVNTGVISAQRQIPPQ